MVASLLLPLAQDRYSLPGQREDFHAYRTRFWQEVGKNRLAIERIGRVLLQLGTIGQADLLLNRRHQRGLLALIAVVLIALVALVAFVVLVALVALVVFVYFI